eukprot:7171731-Pyramimonas_sp.AAC.1
MPTGISRSSMGFFLKDHQPCLQRPKDRRAVCEFQSGALTSARVRVEGHDWPRKMPDGLVHGVVDLRRRLRRLHKANYVRDCD